MDARGGSGEKVGSVQRMRFNQSERLAVESTEAGKRGQATGEASDGQQRTSERVTHANRRTIQTMLYNIQTLGGVDWKPGDTGICWLI